MRRLVVFLVLSVPMMVGGCIPFLAGYAGGQAAAGGEKIDYYLTTHDVSPQIERHMHNETLCKGMNEEQVRLVMGARRWYSSDPDFTSEAGDKKRLVFEAKNADRPSVVVQFDNGRVVDFGHSE